MKSPKMTVVALLSALTVSSVVANDDLASKLNNVIRQSAETSQQAAQRAAKELAEQARLEELAARSGFLKGWDSAKAKFGACTKWVGDKASKHPVAIARIKAGLTGLGAGAVGAAGLHGLIKAGQYGVNKFQNWRNKDEATTQDSTTGEDTRPWYKRHQKKLIGAGVGVAGLAATPFVFKYGRGVDFTAQKNAVKNALKTAGNFALDKTKAAYNWATNNKTALGSGVLSAGAYAAYVASGDYVTSEEQKAFRNDVLKLVFEREDVALAINKSEEAQKLLKKLKSDYLSVEDRAEITAFLDKLVSDLDRVAEAEALKNAAELKRKAEAKRLKDAEFKRKAAEDKRLKDAELKRKEELKRKAAEDKRKADAAKRYNQPANKRVPLGNGDIRRMLNQAQVVYMQQANCGFTADQLSAIRDFEKAGHKEAQQVCRYLDSPHAAKAAKK